MRQALPVMIEDGEMLKPRLPRDRDGRKRPRLQMRYRLARGQADTRQEVAQLLGVHRHTVGHGLARDASGGLDALLALYVPAGNPLSRPTERLAALEQALRQPAGFASSEALRQWIKQAHPRAVHDHTLSTIVRTRFKAKRTGPRPSHTKNPPRPCRRCRPAAASGCRA